MNASADPGPPASAPASAPAGALLALRRGAAAPLGRVALVALQHLLPSIVPLFRRFAADGVAPERTFILGKPYSTVESVSDTLAAEGFHVHVPASASFPIGEYTDHFRAEVGRFWSTVAARLPAGVDRIVVLDEGGWLCRDAPQGLADRHPLVGVEHTMYGLLTTPAGSRSFPVVLMAASAAKTQFENVVIADAIVERLLDATSLHDKPVGLIGLGNIGRALAFELAARGVSQLHGYDIRPQALRDLGFVRRAAQHSELVQQCEVLLGCTGRDTLDPGTALHHVNGRRWLASCSSGDVEFLRVARRLARRTALRSDPFADVRGMVGSAEVVLLNGGFPINFDRVREREQPRRIQLTRELTYASVLQAALCVDPEGPEQVMLDPDLQRRLVTAWLCDDVADSFPRWQRDPAPEWWQRSSGGDWAGASLSDSMDVVA